jgi:hypothetical protein
MALRNVIGLYKQESMFPSSCWFPHLIPSPKRGEVGQ